MSILTAANQLTVLRLLLVPVFALCMLYERPGWALVTFAVAGATDALDGLIARRTGQFTTLGAWLDPMADKLLVATMFVMLTVAIVNLAVARRTFRPSLAGKVATVVYVVTGVVTLFSNHYGARLALVDWCVYASLAITLVSGFEYVVLLTRGATDPPEAE